MLAHWHGQTMNWSELGRSMGVSDHNVRHYLDGLASTFMVRALPPWHAKLAKRQVKAPKVYVRDSGLLHTLLDVQDQRGLEGHPKVGASWEGYRTGRGRAGAAAIFLRSRAAVSISLPRIRAARPCVVIRARSGRDNR